MDWWSIQRSPLNIYQNQALVKILTIEKIAEIKKAIFSISQNPPHLYQLAWDKIQSFEKPELKEVIRWANQEIEDISKMKSNLE